MATPGDVELTTTSGKKTSVLALLSEMRTRWDAVEPERQRARLLESVVYNRMRGRGALERMVTNNLPLLAPNLTKNKVKNTLLTWSARMSKDRTMAVARPSDATDGDIAKAYAGDAILDYQRQVQDRDALMSRLALTCGMHGTVGAYETWDYDAGPTKEREAVLDALGMPYRDPATGEPMYNVVEGRGAPFVELLTIFDFVTDGAKDVQKNGKWLLVRRLLDPDEAKCALRAAMEEAKQTGRAGPPDDNVNIDHVQSRQQVGPTREAVEAWEMWWRPGDMGRLAEGLFAVVISNKVVRATTYPYEHKQLPIAVWRCMDVDDDFYGATWLEDAVPLQIGLNHSKRVLAHRAEISGQIRGLMDGEIKIAWGDSPDGIIEENSAEKRQNGVTFPEVPGIPKDMYEMCDRYEQDIADVAGVSDVASAGDAAASTKNARLVAYATQIDELKSEHTARNRDEMELIVDQQTLSLWQQFVKLQRLVMVVGEDNVLAASYFSGAEIRGVDVRLEAAPGTERLSASRAKDADEQTMAGRLDPSRGNEMARTGLSGTADDASARARVQGLVQQALAGAPVQADLTIDPELAIRELRMALEQLAPHGAKATMPVRALLQEYMENKSQQALPSAPGPQPQGGAPPGQAAQRANTLPRGAM